MSCQRNIAGPEEDCGSHVGYTPCGKPGTHLVEADRGDCYMCPEHAEEAQANGFAVSELVLIEVAT